MARRRALHVDHRRFTGDGDRFRDRADFHLASILIDAGPDTMTSSRFKGENPASVNVTCTCPAAGSRSGTARPHRHCRPGFFNQDGLDGFDGDAGQHGT
jgi:hypothetical protein